MRWKSELDRLGAACAKALSNVSVPAKLNEMKAVPGTLQDGGAAFATTHWSVVLLAAQNESPEAAQAALTTICQAYWPPLYTFLRRRGNPPANAQDLVQAFFANLLEQNSLSRVQRDKGRLRTFLLSALQHFLANEHDRTQTQKRGGGQQIISLEEHFEEAEASLLMNVKMIRRPLTTVRPGLPPCSTGLGNSCTLP